MNSIFRTFISVTMCQNNLTRNLKNRIDKRANNGTFTDLLTKLVLKLYHNIFINYCNNTSPKKYKCQRVIIIRFVQSN